MPLLRLGSRGPDVAELQTLLTRAGFTVKVDSLFGVLTESAVRSYQGEFGLRQDGIAGPKTLARLRAEMTEDTDPAIVLPIWGVDVSEYNPVATPYVEQYVVGTKRPKFVKRLLNFFSLRRNVWGTSECCQQKNY